jgi:hypothetical protein
VLGADEAAPNTGGMRITAHPMGEDQ